MIEAHVSKFHEYMAARKVTPANPMIDSAVSLGLPCFPCGSDKRPLTAHGFKDASDDPAVIRAAFANPSAVMIGVPTGRITGWAVIDIDCKDGMRGQEWLDANTHRIPSTRTHATRSGGWHLIFRMPDTELRNSASKIAPGVDVRAEGGYVIVPPSTGYHLIPDGLDLAELPEWLLAEASKRPEPVARPIQAQPLTRAPLTDGGTAYGIAALDSECEAIRTAPDGNKHHTVNKAAYAIGGLVTAGELSEGSAFAELSAAMDTILPYCKDKRAAQNTLRTAFREGMSKARQVPELAPASELTQSERESINASCGPMLAKLAQRHAETVKQKAEADAMPIPVSTDIMQPGGVLQMIMDECKRTAIRAQPFLWLGAAICAVGTLAGRRYESPSGLRTNVYVAAVAESGSGKDHAPSVVRRAMSAAGLERYMGGEDLASGSGLYKSLSGHPARMFILDELGMFLRSVTGRNAAAHKAEIWEMFIKIYSRAKEQYFGKEYANNDGKNERADIWYPHPVVYGMTTPSTFWASLEGGAMLDGGLARFLLFLSDQDLPPRNKRPGNPETPEEMIIALQNIAHGPGEPPGRGGNLPAMHLPPMSAKAKSDVYRVPMTADADDIHDRHMTEDQDAWSVRRKGTPDVPIISRLGENAIKLALIRAISTNAAAPVIGAVEIEWGWQLALHCTRSMLKEASRFIADSDYERKLNKALDIIRRHGPITEYGLLRVKGFSALGKESERRELLHTLTSANLVTAITQPAGPSGGRPTVKYVASQNQDGYA